MAVIYLYSEPKSCFRQWSS